MTVSSPSTSRAANRSSDRSSVLSWCSAHQGLCFAVLSGVWVLALYWNAIGAPFIYDDLDHIVNNPALASFHKTFVQFCMAPVTLSNRFRGVGGSTYRPLFWLSVALDRRVWGIADASGFHVTNIFLHWVNGLLLFVYLKRIRVASLTAAAAALIWLGLPINSEVVAWVSGRAYSLCLLFILASLLAAYFYCKSGGMLLLGGYFVAAFAALLSHEEGVLILPLTILSAYAAGNMPRRLWSHLTSAFVFAGAVYFTLKHLVRSPVAKGAPALWSVGLTFWKYVQWMIAPVHMSVERSTSTPVNAATPAAIATWAALLLFAAVIILVRKKMPTVAAGLAWCFLALLPFCGEVFIYQGMAERYVYVASAGFAVAIASLTLEYARVWRGIASGVVVLWVLWGAWRLRTRVLDWGDPVSLYESSLEAAPDSPTLLAHLGDAALEKGDLDKAEKAFNRALVFWPDDMGSVINLAVAYEQSGDKQGAEREFKRAIVLAPHQSVAYTDLGTLLFQEGRVDEAIRCFQSAMTNNPTDPTAYFDLAVLFQQSGRDELAMPFYRKVLELRPGDPDTIANVSKLHLKR
jgi:protein O-mannosyl-transferase